MVYLQIRLLVGEVCAKLLSHASDGAAEVTWPRRDVVTESCWHDAWSDLHINIGQMENNKVKGK
jgi:hypothetical protein